MHNSIVRDGMGNPGSTGYIPGMGEEPSDAVSQDLLEEMVCFDLHAASRAMTSVYRPLLEPLGLTYPQYLVLTVLWERGTQPIGAVVERLEMDYGTISARLAAGQYASPPPPHPGPGKSTGMLPARNVGKALRHVLRGVWVAFLCGQKYFQGGPPD